LRQRGNRRADGSTIANIEFKRQERIPELGTQPIEPPPASRSRNDPRAIARKTAHRRFTEAGARAGHENDHRAAKTLTISV